MSFINLCIRRVRNTNPIGNHSFCSLAGIRVAFVIARPQNECFMEEPALFPPIYHVQEIEEKLSLFVQQVTCCVSHFTIPAELLQMVGLIFMPQPICAKMINIPSFHSMLF